MVRGSSARGRPQVQLAPHLDEHFRPHLPVHLQAPHLGDASAEAAVRACRQRARAWGHKGARGGRQGETTGRTPGLGQQLQNPGTDPALGTKLSPGLITWAPASASQQGPYSSAGPPAGHSPHRLARVTDLLKYKPQLWTLSGLGRMRARFLTRFSSSLTSCLSPPPLPPSTRRPACLPLLKGPLVLASGPLHELLFLPRRAPQGWLPPDLQISADLSHAQRGLLQKHILYLALVMSGHFDWFGHVFSASPHQNVSCPRAGMSTVSGSSLGS